MLHELTFEITQKCPNACVYCSSNSDKNCGHWVKSEVFKRTVDEAKSLGVTSINFSGGEPLLHSDIFNYISYCKGIGLQTILYTSGLLLDKENNTISLDQNTVDNLKSNGIDKVIVNLQGWHSASIEDINKNKGSKELIFKSLGLLAKSIHTEINFIPTKLSCKSILHIAEIAYNLGIKNINILALVLQGKALIYRDRLIMDDTDLHCYNMLFREALKYYPNMRLGTPMTTHALGNCNAYTGKMVIRYDGAVYPCEAYKYLDSFKGYKPENINDKPFKDIYEKSRFLQEIHNYIELLRCSHSCESCPAQVLLKDFLQKIM